MGLSRLIHVELRKQVDTGSGRGLLIAIAVISAIAVAGVMYFSRDEGASFAALVTATGTPMSMLIPVLGIITACNEWSQRTALITFTHEPRRWRVVAAKCLAALIWATGLLLLAWVLAALAHLISVSMAGHHADINFTAVQFLAGWINQTILVLMGLGFGFLLLVTPLAVVAYYVVPSLVTGVTVAVPALQRLTDWLTNTTVPLANAVPEGIQDPNDLWVRFAVSMVVWVVLPLALGTLRVLRREIK